MNKSNVKRFSAFSCFGVVLTLLFILTIGSDALGVSKKAKDSCVAAGGKVTGPGPVGEYWCCYTQSDGGVDCDLLGDDASTKSHPAALKTPKRVVKTPDVPKPVKTKPYATPKPMR